MLEAVASRDGGGTPEIQVVRTLAVRSEGIAELVDAIDAHGRWLDESGERASQRRTRAMRTIRNAVLSQLRRRVDQLDCGGFRQGRGRLTEDLSGAT